MKRAAVLLFLTSAWLLATIQGAAGGLRWTVPERWEATAQRPMRVATYKIPAAPGTGTEDGECGIFYFGKGQGGSVEENVERWAGQFEPRETPRTAVDPPTKGKPPAVGNAVRSTVVTKTINRLKVHTIEIAGTYLSPGGPMMQSQGKRPGWRLAGAIVEAPEGLVFFKCTGPAATIEKARKELDALLASLVSVGGART